MLSGYYWSKQTGIPSGREIDRSIAVLEKPVLHIYDIRKERELETVQKLAHVETASAAAERATQAEEAHAVAADKGGANKRFAATEATRC